MVFSKNFSCWLRVTTMENKSKIDVFKHCKLKMKFVCKKPSKKSWYWHAPHLYFEIKIHYSPLTLLVDLLLQPPTLRPWVVCGLQREKMTHSLSHFNLNIRMYGEQLLNTHKLAQTIKQIRYLFISFRQNQNFPNIVAKPLFELCALQVLEHQQNSKSKYFII